MKKLFYFLVVLTMMLSCDKEKLTVTNDVQDKDDTVPVDDIETFTVEGVTFRMVKVEGGTFQMGLSYVGENCDPVHDVTLSSYYIGETEVTWGLWTAVMGSNHPYYDYNPDYDPDDNCPVVDVSWDDCQEFIRKLNQLTGRTFSLPTEAQWEFAARGGNKSCGYEFSGSHIIDDVAWYHDNSSIQTHPVGTRQANELGLYDMSGNVEEWCRDWYGQYSSSPQTDPTGASTGKYRVVRGGDCHSGAYQCRSIHRGYNEPDYRNAIWGFRLVLIF